ncbi:MAG: DUF4365 domain-containing protein [Acidimicrobiia bacterium]|nr:DUF4365 domain-containing protein [Acidimicrobiia bacterium]MYC43959.1 DUF4365 domain-containing protein [Acidimicrobiia bacterium]MYI20350.1 DUF4365 domain-containing protein [Acidimicrobiia bacterium]
MDTPESSVTADVAVGLVQVIVGKQLGWIVRPQLQADKGIDAHIEVVQDGKATGQLVALQIKGGESWFREPTADGLVFRPKAKHVAYWLAHSLPVAVVLVDVDEEIAYWQLVTRETVTSTGKGWKMIIPAANTFSMPAASELLAASEGAANTWTLRSAQLARPWSEDLPDGADLSVDEWIDKMSGSVSILLTAVDESGAVVARSWADVEHSTTRGRDILVLASEAIDDDHDAAEYEAAPSHDAPSLDGTSVDLPTGAVPAGCELRCALVAPRLVAPHPHSGQSVNAAEGVALLAQGRLRGLKNLSDQHEDVPDPEDPNAAGDWGWRFVAAIWDWALTDSTASLEAVFESAHDRRSAAASGVFVACALARLRRHSDAVAALTPLVEDEEMDSVDRAWVLVQRARVSAEIGDLESCRGDALRARDLLVGHSDDVTASAIAAAVEWQLSMSAPIEDRDYLSVAAAADTSVSLWRWQRVGWGLASAADAGFRQWAQELSITIGGSRDHGGAELFGAELCADLAGEHAAWKTFASLRARLRIQHAAGSNNETNELIEGLDALVCSGDDKSLKLALGHLLWDGPIDVAASVVSRIGAGGWTRTTVPTSFAALEIAGDLLGEDAAGEMLAWLSHVAGDGIGEFLDRYRPTVTVDFAAYGAMAGLVPAAARPAHSSIAAFIAAQRTDLPDVMARHLASQLGWLNFYSVEDAGRVALRQTAFREQSYIGTRILGWLAANGDTEALDRLKSQATEGDLDALAEIADVELLSNTEAAALIPLLDERASEALSEMRAGRYNTGSINTLDALTLLNLRFPDTARWSVVHEVLSEPLALADQKSAMCMRLAALADLVPASERDMIVANIDTIAIAKEGFWPGTNMAGVDIIVAAALGAMGADEADAAVTRLALGSHQQRTNATKLLGLGHCPEMRPVLTHLIRDPSPQVRLEAARSIGSLAARTPDALAAELARHVASTDGLYLPRALLGGLSADSPLLNDTSEELVADLQEHPSARIRWQARLLTQS